MKKDQIKSIHTIIFDWYQKEGRHDLPWRATTDLYQVAVSEIMLQQTNVPKVIEKYNAFIKKYPTVKSLAQAQQKDVVLVWRGLGYNRRALYLHKMAQFIVHERAGIFPGHHEELIELPGIGPYTSRSILVFAMNVDIATWDVNIVRVFRRLHGKRKATEALIEKWCLNFLPKGRSRDWHNALMDFASLICSKRAPLCSECPLKDVCASYPCPNDQEVKRRKEVGRRENGKHIPRRIYRGRIVEYLRENTATVNDIGCTIKSDWNAAKDRTWCEKILVQLEKEGMTMYKNGKWMLQ